MIFSRAPVRISMGGGGTDLPSYYKRRGGFLMAAAINKYVHILAEKRFHPSIRLSYSKTEIVDNIDNIEHRIFRECLRLVGIKNQIELASVADVPSKCGLGTSSTFTVALLNALYSYKQEYVSLDRLAEKACHIEMKILKEPVGKQDQYASSLGGFNAYWFNKNGTVIWEPVKIKQEKLMELQSNLFLFYLNIERAAGDILKIQNSKSNDDDKETLSYLDKIKAIGIQTKKIFESGKLDDFGEILHEHWLTKKKLSNDITDPSIDYAYNLARKNGGVGGKVVGAGGGGFLMIYCPKNKQKLVHAMEKNNLKPMWFNFEPEGAKIIFNG